MRRVTFATAIGCCAIRWNEVGLVGFELPEASTPNEEEGRQPEEITSLIQRVQRHLRGEKQDFSDLIYDFTEVSPFNASVLRATLTIKSGETRTYGEIATQIGQPLAMSRAVGSALGANRWPLIIPCHRVVAADGAMTGFSGPGGIKTKLKLLALEGAQLFAE